MAKLNFINDCVSEIDYLGYLPYIQAFEYLINNNNKLMTSPIVFGIHGEWGVGKSTFMQLIKNKINAAEKYHIIDINPWEYKEDESFIAIFLAKLYDEIKDEFPGDTIGKLLKAIIKPFKISSDFKLAKIEYDFSKLALDEQKSLIDKYISDNFAMKKIIEDFLHEKYFENKKIIIFIDDLDRCSVDKVIEVIEGIKLIFNSKNCIFFLGCDKGYLESAISVKYEKFIKYIEDEAGSYNISAYKKNYKEFSREYLEKIIQVPFLIPPLGEESIEKYVNNILAIDENYEDIQYGSMSDDTDFYKEFIQNLNKHMVVELMNKCSFNPRKMKRVLILLFLNYLFIRFKNTQNKIEKYELDLMTLLSIIRELDYDYYMNFMSNEIMCKNIFIGHHEYLINKKDKDVPYRRNNKVNDCFNVFLCETGYNKKTKAQLDESLKSIATYISVSNITISKDYSSTIGIYKSDTETNKKLQDFLKRVNDIEVSKEFIGWFFTHIFEPNIYEISINQNIHIYKKKFNGNFNHLEDFIFRFEYDDIEKALYIKFERGKYQTFLSGYEQKFSDLSLYDKDRRLLKITESSTAEDIEKIKEYIEEVNESLINNLGNISYEEVAAGE